MTVTSWLAEQHREGWVRVDLNRSAEPNVLDAALIEGLLDSLDRAEETVGTRVFVIGASGPAFCTGLRLDGSELRDWLAGDTRLLCTLLYRLAVTPLVSVALVQGAAIGGGVGLAAACDHVIAGPDASFRLTEVLVGLVPAAIFPVLARRTGEHLTFSLALTARRLDSVEALRVGLADEVAAEPEAALRAFLAGLRRAGDSTLCALKAYRNELCPPTRYPAASAAAASREHIDANAVVERIARLRKSGLL
jgi:polyketide biosynthesis enoyl-CoA hydratase PksH